MLTRTTSRFARPIFPDHRDLRDQRFWRVGMPRRGGNRPLPPEPFLAEFPWAIAAKAGLWAAIVVVAVYVLVLPVIQGFALLTARLS